MALTSSTTTKVTTAWNATELTQVLVGGSGSLGVGDVIFAGDLPFGSAHMVLTTGAFTSGTIQLTVANDGLLSAGTPQPLTNPVNLGPAVTALPNIIDLATGTIAATAPTTVGGGFAQTPYKYFQFLIAGATTTFTVTITMVFMGTRG